MTKHDLKALESHPAKIDLIDGSETRKFSLENLRVSQDFVEQASVETVHGVITVGKPDKQDFFRVHPGEDRQLLVATIEYGGQNGERWIVMPDLAARICDEVSYVLLRLAVTRQAVPFLWPLKMPRNGNTNTWNLSAMVAAETATTHWVRMQANQQMRRYDVVKATADLILNQAIPAGS